MLRVNTSSSWAPVTHTAKPSPWGTDSPLWPLSQEGLRTVNSCRETTMGHSHTFPQITLPSWWGLMYTAAGGTSADQAISFRSHSRPWSIPTQNRASPPQPRSEPSGLGGLRVLMLSESLPGCSRHFKLSMFSWIAMKDTLQPTKLEGYTIWLFLEKICYSLIWNIF